MPFEFKKFELELPEGGGCSIMLIGASRAGKTTMLKHIYNTHFEKYITVMTSMNRQADIYKDLSDRICLTDKFHSELFKEAHEINTICNNKYPFLFISDDYVDLSIKNDPEIIRAMTIYRNANISSIWSFQGRTLMSAVGRNNGNFILIFKQNTPSEWIAVIKDFLSMWLPVGMRMNEMIDFCRQATENHQLFVIDQIKGECYLTKLTPAQAGL